MFYAGPHGALTTSGSVCSGRPESSSHGSTLHPDNGCLAATPHQMRRYDDMNPDVLARLQRAEDLLTALTIDVDQEELDNLQAGWPHPLDTGTCLAVS